MKNTMLFLAALCPLNCLPALATGMSDSVVDPLAQDSLHVELDTVVVVAQHRQ